MKNSLKEVLQRFSKDVTSIFLKEGDYLLRQNDPADAVFVVVTGQLHAILEEPEKEDRVVAEIGPGETVGEMSIVTQRARSTSVRASRDSELRRISKEHFEKLILLDNPQVLLEFTRLIALRLDKTTRLREIEFKPKNILVMPAGNDFELFASHAQLLAEVLSKRGRVKILNADIVARMSPQIDFVSANEVDLDNNSNLIQWFNNIEDNHDFIISISNKKMDWWTKRCLRNADRIYLVANAQKSEALNEMEKHIFQENILKTTRLIELVLIHPNQQKIGTGTGKWLDLRKVFRSHHVEIGNTAHIERQSRFLLGEAFGLVLGGGGAKGLAHIGVIRALRECNIPIDMIGGTSVGSIVAGLHALGLDPNEQIAAFKKMVTSYSLKKYTFPLMSLLARSSIDEAYSYFFGASRIEDLFTNYFCISCNLNTAQKVVHDRGLLCEAIRASTSIPGVYTPVLLDHSLLIDGGIMDNLPAEEMKKRGAKTVIAVDVASRNDLNVDADLAALPSGWKMFIGKLSRQKKTKIPNILEILMRTLLLNSINRSSETMGFANLVLRPPVEKIGMLEFRKVEEAEKIGYDYAKPLIEAYKKTLG